MWHFIISFKIDILAALNDLEQFDIGHFVSRNLFSFSELVPEMGTEVETGIGSLRFRNISPDSYVELLHDLLHLQPPGVPVTPIHHEDPDHVLHNRSGVVRHHDHLHVTPGAPGDAAHHGPEQWTVEAQEGLPRLDDLLVPAQQHHVGVVIIRLYFREKALE